MRAPAARSGGAAGVWVFKTKQKKKQEREKEETEQTPSIRLRPINFDFGQFRLRPISSSASFFFSSSANSTSANFDFGQFRLRPISTSASFFFRVRPIRLRPISTSANFDFGQFLDVEYLDHKRWGPQRVEPKGGAQKGGGPKISRFFFPFPPQFRCFFLSLGVLSWNFGGV